MVLSSVLVHVLHEAVWSLVPHLYIPPSLWICLFGKQIPFASKYCVRCSLDIFRTYCEKVNALSYSYDTFPKSGGFNRDSLIHVLKAAGKDPKDYNTNDDKWNAIVRLVSSLHCVTLLGSRV